MVVVFSGGGTAGHFHPACNIANALVRELPGAQPFFVGTEGRIEAAELPKIGHPYVLLRTRGLRRPLREARRAGGVLQGLGRFAGAMADNAKAVALLATAVARLIPEFRRRKARGVVLTGGYVAASAGLAAVLLRLPVLVQEQNMRPGITTRLVSLWARQIHLAYPEAAAGLPKRARRRVRDTGNPIRPVPSVSAQRKEAARRAMELPAKAPVVLVVGGSQGAQALNRAVAQVLSDDAHRKDETVVWVAGRQHHEDAERAVARAGTKNVRVVPYLEPEEMYRALAAADVAVSRAGAMATSEFLAWGLPAVLVPFPAAAEDHQADNARGLEAAGAAVHLPESGSDGRVLTGQRLWETVRGLLDDPARLEAMAAAARRRARPGAAREIAAAVAELATGGGAPDGRLAREGGGAPDGRDARKDGHVPDGRDAQGGSAS